MVSMSKAKIAKTVDKGEIKGQRGRSTGKRMWTYTTVIPSRLAASAEGDLLLELEDNNVPELEKAVASANREHGLLRVTVRGKTYHFSSSHPTLHSRDEVVQRLVDASHSNGAKAEAIEARMRARAVETVMGGTAWLTATELVADLPNKPSNVHTMLARWLQQGRIFALEKNGVRIFPRYAFDAMLEPVPILKDVLKVLHGRSPFQIAAWFESTSAHLNGKRPREVLEQDGVAVVMAAQRLVEGAVHG